MANRIYECPECGSDTVVEVENIMGILYKVERCDGLVEIAPDKPLDACKWSQELQMISNGIVKER